MMALASALALTGCATVGVGAIPAPPPAPTTPVGPDEPTSDVAPSPEDGKRAVFPPEITATGCAATRGLALNPGGIDAALGTRSMSLEIINCGTKAVQLGDPQFIAADVDGNVVDASHEPTRGPRLAPGERTFASLSWANNGRCERGAQRLVVVLNEQAFDITQPCLLLGGPYAAERATTLRFEWATG